MRLGRDGGGRDVACVERDPSDVEVVNPRLGGGPRVRTCRRGAGESCVKGGEEAMREEDECCLRGPDWDGEGAPLAGDCTSRSLVVTVLVVKSLFVIRSCRKSGEGDEEERSRREEGQAAV
jgi:hypothetical protein